ncbi:MAG: hypothetical protein NT062_28260 [Proteobacteria bacterium]|nr:hypothetical protein [Pseudomonadota bacterium]
MTTIGDLVGARIATVLPDVIEPADAAALRARFATSPTSRYALVDRGAYDAVPVHDLAPFADLVPFARDATERDLVIAEARVLRLRPGDYLLAHHDRVYEGFPIELVVDLSVAPIAGAEIHYRRRGQVFFRVPNAPGSVAIVERGPTVTCNHTYVSKRHPPDVEVVRLILLLQATSATKSSTV